jgi:hypothetical protein
MATKVVGGSEPVERREVDARGAEIRECDPLEPQVVAKGRVHAGQSGVFMAGSIALLVSAWGGIVPYVGPLFGYGGNGSGAWHWDLAHTVLALIPGAAGVLLALFVMAETRGIKMGRGRMSLATAGVLLMACGAWFAIGFLAWPVLTSGTSYFTAGSHLRLLADEIGYSIGTGIVLVVCGAFIDGWAARHQPRGAVVADRPARVEWTERIERAPGTVESGI